MSDTKENTGWTTPDAAPGGWNKADTERLAEYEQGYRERSEAKLAKRESTAERVEVVEERDVTDPSRVYTPRSRARLRRSARQTRRSWQAAGSRRL